MTSHGQRLTAIDNRLMYAPEADIPNFPAFLNHYLLDKTGDDWARKEYGKPLDERHPIIAWHESINKLVDGLVSGSHSDDQLRFTTGAFLGWLRLAYDLFTIENNAKFQNQLLGRLLDGSQFQGARHELAVAAALVAAGFNIEYPEDRPENKKRGMRPPDLIATHLATGLRVAVEAKSKHREGVYGYMPPQKGSVHSVLGIYNQLKEAQLKDCNGLPLIVCIDLNFQFVPMPIPEGLAAEIFACVSKVEEELGPHTPASGYLISNDPCHRHADESMDVSASLWATSANAASPRVEIPNPNLMAQLRAAFMQRANFPLHFPASNP